VFFLDIEGHRQDRNIQEALKAATTHAAMVKLLGSYPAAC